MRTKDSGTKHVLVNLQLTLYRLTGWVASLDTTRTTPGASSATEQRPPMPCMTYWFWTWGGVKHERFGGERSRTARQHSKSKQDLTHVPDSGELLIQHHHIFGKLENRHSRYTQQVGYGSVPGWCRHWRCRYPHLTR